MGEQLKIELKEPITPFEAVLRARDLSREDVHSLSGVHRNTVSRVALGKTYPGGKTVAKLVEKLKIDAGILIDQSGCAHWLLVPGADPQGYTVHLDDGAALAQMVARLKGMADVQLGEQARLHRQTVARVLAGESNPDPATGLKLAHALGVPVQTLVNPKLHKVWTLVQVAADLPHSQEKQSDGAHVPQT